MNFRPIIQTISRSGSIRARLLALAIVAMPAIYSHAPAACLGGCPAAVQCTPLFRISDIHFRSIAICDRSAFAFEFEFESLAIYTAKKAA